MSGHIVRTDAKRIRGGNIKAVILTGGRGSRLEPTTEVYNKHVVHVYDKPMIHYPLRTLAEMGCSDVIIVASPQGVGDIAETVKDGAEFDLNVEYRIQREPLGVGNAIKQAERSLERYGRPFPIMLGDCYYDPAPRPYNWDRPTMFWHEFETGDQHSVWIPEVDAIFEKPRHVDVGKRAIIGYVYDQRVFEFIDRMEPDGRTGELEIVDIHNFYRENGADLIEYQGFFGDMGTPAGLLRVANHEAQR